MPTHACEPLEGGERLIANVVLNALGVSASRLLADADGTQERENDFYMCHAHQSEFVELGWMSVFDVRETVA